MNKQLLAYTIIGFLFVVILGSISHYFYDWSNQFFPVGFFSPVNESIWEHMKLLFFPMLLWIIFMIFQLDEAEPCLRSGFSAGLLSGTLLIPVLFYAYSGILGRHYLILDILVFIISTIIAFANGYWFTTRCRFFKYTGTMETLVLILMICFFIFTYNPPAIPLFQE